MVGLYVVAEQGAGFWGVTHLVSLGWQPQAAAVVFSSFWLVLLIGRLIGAALAVRFSSELVLVLGLFGSTLAFLTEWQFRDSKRRCGSQSFPLRRTTRERPE